MDFYDGTHGTKQLGLSGDAWPAIVSNNVKIKITFEFTENGDLVLYRNGVCVLKFNANRQNDAGFKISDMTRAFINDVHTNGFSVANLFTSSDNENNSGVTLSNLQVGYATDLHQDVKYKVMVGENEVLSYHAPYLPSNNYVSYVPYGYTLVSSNFENGVMTLNCTKNNVTLSDNLLSTATNIDRFNTGNWAVDQFVIATNVEGDYYYEVEINNIEVNDHAGNTWRGLLLNTVGINGNDCDEVICLGNSNSWCSRPAQFGLTHLNNNGDVFNQKMDMKLTMTRKGRFYYVTMECTYDGNTIVNSFSGIGYDNTIKTLSICSEFARFTVSSIKSGKIA